MPPELLLPEPGEEPVIGEMVAALSKGDVRAAIIPFLSARAEDEPHPFFLRCALAALCRSCVWGCCAACVCQCVRVHSTLGWVEDCVCARACCVCRSLYLVCLLLSVKHGLFGFGTGTGVPRGFVGSGDGSLEDGLLLAIQALGGVCVGGVCVSCVCLLMWGACECVCAHPWFMNSCASSVQTPAWMSTCARRTGLPLTPPCATAATLVFYFCNVCVCVSVRTVAAVGAVLHFCVALSVFVWSKTIEGVL